MSQNKRRTRLLLLIGVLIVVLFGGVYLLFNIDNSESELARIRTQVDLLLKADSPAVRQKFAKNMIEIAEPLIEREGVVSDTASMYVISASPVAGYVADHVEIPPAKQVKEIPSNDLLPIINLLYKTSRFGPADQLLGLILSRDEPTLRKQILQLACSVRVDLGRDEDVLTHCDELIALDATDPFPYRLQSMVHRNHGRWDNFITAEEKVVELTGGADVVSHVGLVDGYLRLGRTADARREFDRVIQKLPSVKVDAPTMYARLLMQEGDNEPAIVVLKKHLANDPSDAEAYVMLGTLQVSQSRFEDAIATLQAAINVSPAEEKAYYQLGQAYARLGKSELGQAALKKHRALLDEKVRLFELEQQAAREPLNVDVKLELADSYEKIGIQELADFWRRSAAAAE